MGGRGKVRYEQIKVPGGAGRDAAVDGAVHAEEGDDILEVGFDLGGDGDMRAEGSDGCDCLVFICEGEREKRREGETYFLREEGR